MAKYITEAMIALRLTWFRVSMIFLIPSLTTFLAQTETWSGETWDETHWFLKTRIFIISFIPGATALVAFADNTLQKAKDEIARRRSGADSTGSTGVTQIIHKSDLP